MEGRSEVKAKDDKLCFFFLHALIFLSFILHESEFCIGDAVTESPSGLRPKMGHSNM